MQTTQITLQNEHGIHTRSAAQIVDCAIQFASRITLAFNGTKVDAKRIMQVLTLGATSGGVVDLSIDGPDEQEALLALQSLIEHELI